MVLPVNPPGQDQIARSPHGNEAGLWGGAKNAGRHLRTLSFHLIALLLGIALAFM
jgi:hypothetical protein